MESNKNRQQDYRSQVGQCADAARDARHDATDNEHRQNEQNRQKGCHSRNMVASARRGQRPVPGRCRLGKLRRISRSAQSPRPHSDRRLCAVSGHQVQTAPGVVGIGRRYRDELNAASNQEFALSILGNFRAVVVPRASPLRYLTCSTNARSLGET